MELTAKKCVPCEGGVDPLTGAALQEYLKQVGPEWQVRDEKKITREYTFPSFREAIDFVNKVADLAESEGHHPNLNILYKKVVAELWTFAINGLSENDFILAAKMDALYSQDSE